MSEQVLVALTGATSRILDGVARRDGLTAAEQRRMASLRRGQDRDDFLAAHLLVRACVGRLLGCAAGGVSIVQRCATCGGPHGRPEVAGHPAVRASLAHSRGVVAAAAGRVPVGIDVEALAAPGGDVALGELSGVLTAAERTAIEAAEDRSWALLLTWVRKEACVKAGLADLERLDRLDLSALPVDPPPGHRTLRSLRHGQWAVHDWWDRQAGAVGAVVVPTGTTLALPEM